MKTNILTEITKVLERNGKTINDIKWIGNDQGEIPIEVFKATVDFDYDNDDDYIEIDSSLIIVGNNWWLERKEDDEFDIEWWEFMTPPKRPKETAQNPRIIYN